MPADLPASRRKQAILLVLAVTVVSFAGITGARMVFSLYGLELGAGTAGIGSIMALMYLCPLLLSWPIGRLVDRFAARWLLAGGTACGAVGMLAPALAPKLASIYVAAAVLGIALACCTVIGQYLIGALSTPEERARNFSNYALAAALTLFLGPLLIGFSMDHVGSATTCLVIAGLLGGAVLLTLCLGGSLPQGIARPTERAPGQALQTMREPGVWKLLAASSLVQVGNELFQTFLPLHGYAAGLSPSIIGSVMAAFAVGSFAVRASTENMVRRWGEHRVLVWAFHMSALVFLLLPLAQDAWLIGGLAFLFGCGLGCAMPLVMLLVYSGTTDGRAGELIGLRMTANNLARVTAPALLGLLGAATGLMAVFWVSGTLMLAGGRISTIMRRDWESAKRAPSAGH